MTPSDAEDATRALTILAIDLGTQSLRVTAVTSGGDVVWRWSRPVSTHTAGEVSEQDPGDWADLLDTALAEAGRAGLRPDAVAAAGPLAGWVPLDGEGRTLGPAVMYFDGRSAGALPVVAARLADRADVPRPTVADPLPQLLRLQRQAPERLASARHLLDATGWLVFRLTGVATLDPYTAIRLYGGALDDLVGDGRGLFGRPVTLGETVGLLRPEVARQFGGGAIPVIAATFDSKCAYVASGIVREGQALDISGTVTSFGVVAPRPLVDAAKRVYSVPLGDNWLVRGSMGGTGSVLEWVRAAMLGADFDAMEAEIAATPAGAGGVTFLPFHSGARSPLWNPHARGAFLGLSLDTGRPALARAVYEGLCFGLRHIVETMTEQGVVLNDVRLAGGLARSDLLSAMKADILGRPVIRLADHELTTLGLVVIAATSAGAYRSLAAASEAIVRTADRFAPAGDATRYEPAYRRYRAGVDALAPTFAPA